MIDNAGNQQSRKGIEHTDLGGPFDRVRLSRSGTTMKVIKVANAVGYENQGKFAKVFAEAYGVSPLEFRRLSK